jgi:RNA polymerase sigma factor (sigma-70 family)
LTRLQAYRRGSFRAELFTITHHADVDALRARDHLDAYREMGDLPEPTPSPEDEALATEAVGTLREVLVRLSPDQRHVVDIHLAGLRGREIAEVVGLRHDAVRAIQSRAVARLRAILTAPAVEEVPDDER